jgi:hypothetical protein
MFGLARWSTHVEGIIVVAVLTAIVTVAFLLGQASVNKPASTWSDDELARRLPKYYRSVSAHFQGQKF